VTAVPILGPLDSAALVEEEGGKSLRRMYEHALEEMANKYCVEYNSKVGAGMVLCKEIQGLQMSWAEADAKGDTTQYMKVLGSYVGHFCGTPTLNDQDTCKVFKYMRDAVPTELKWSGARKRYLQMTKDVSKHFCSAHGDNDLFCALSKGLQHHYFDAVNERKRSSFLKFVENLDTHYCKTKIPRHPADGRCSIFPLLQKSLPPDP